MTPYEFEVHMQVAHALEDNLAAAIEAVNYIDTWLPREVYEEVHLLVGNARVNLQRAFEVAKLYCDRKEAEHPTDKEG